MKVKELAKDIVLIALIAGAGVLTWKNWVYDEGLLESSALSWLGLGRTEAVSHSVLVEYTDAAVPVRAAVMLGGSRSGAQYDAVPVQEIYGRAKPALGEALGSAAARTGIPVEEWRRCLSLDGFYLAYPDGVPLSALAAWCGAKLNDQLADDDASALILCRDGDNMDLCYTDGTSYYRSATAVPYSAVESSLESPAAGKCSFAYELGGPYGNIAPYSMVTEPSPAPRAVSSGKALDSDEKVSALFKGLGLNPLTNRRYEETDETRVFVEGDCTLRIFPDGRVMYRNSDAAGGENGLFVKTAGTQVRKSEMIEAVRGIIAKTAASFSGDASVVFSSIRENGGEWLLTFNYSVNGVPVYFSAGGFAVQASVKSGVITQMSFRLRSYGLESEETLPLLPEKQAAAALGALGDETKELTLGYIDDGSETLHAQWMGR